MVDSLPQHAQDVSCSEPTLPAPLPVDGSNASTSNRSIPSSPSATGLKRPAPSLLPPFEPLSSSPGLPRPSKRQNTGNNAQFKYPTPMPTSSTGIASSPAVRRPGLVRTMTAASEREPLGALPLVDLPPNNEWLLMGRSSNSSHYQLSANRLVSRVHVQARYMPATSLLEPNKIEIVCNGWNGVTLHSQGRTYELGKGDSFTSESEGTDILLDVQDTRVMIRWPRRVAESGSPTESTWDDSPRRQPRLDSLQPSPLRRRNRLESPVSPTPAGLGSSARLQGLFGDDDGPNIQIFEDDAEPELPGSPVDVNASMLTEATASFHSELSEPEEDENDPDEENDPVIHSFGPFGANISSRFASISTFSPKADASPSRRGQSQSSSSNEMLPPKRDVLEEAAASSESESDKEDTPTPSVRVSEAVTNHVINQLAYSRLSSTPLTTIMVHLPVEHKEGLEKEVLREAIEATSCIGIIERQGKDAAGKPLESEYYYLPENDDDQSRRAAVVDGLRKPSLRNCRKQHKQYYWKRPRTP
ncbi:hypothetical protein N3K66_007717 [Trichothecium roseum]|uniref:Uncharacterized protein n=1 Tax=Trichothecium roseum TaxID=47278 RepID=A0ACC0UUR0_9HYPO|nr:hypothetical protein N3K66_007717 [Trichothecium roseum]